MGADVQTRAPGSCRPPSLAIPAQALPNLKTLQRGLHGYGRQVDASQGHAGRVDIGCARVNLDHDGRPAATEPGPELGTELLLEGV